MDTVDSAALGTAGMTAEAARGRATGALFFLGFGTVWMFVGLKQTHHASRANLVSLAVCSGLLLAMTALLMRRSRDLPAARLSPEAEAKTQRLFNAVNIIQWVSIGTAILILSVLHLPAYIVPVIAVIVGLHLFPLATAFRYPQHNVTGTLLVAWPLGCYVALPPERISGVCATGVATILLLSAAATLFRTFARVRAMAPATITA